LISGVSPSGPGSGGGLADGVGNGASDEGTVPEAPFSPISTRLDDDGTSLAVMMGAYVVTEGSFQRY